MLPPAAPPAPKVPPIPLGPNRTEGFLFVLYSCILYCYDLSLRAYWLAAEGS